MDRLSTRAWRRIQKKRVWRNRLRLIFRAFFCADVDPSTGMIRRAETWKELRKVKWCQVYRTTASLVAAKCVSASDTVVSISRETPKE